MITLLACSIGTAEVALPSTDLLPAHIFAVDTLCRSLFEISDITNDDYDATFRKHVLYLFYHYTTPKSLLDFAYSKSTGHANAVMSPPSENSLFNLYTLSFIRQPRNIYFIARITTWLPLNVATQLTASIRLYVLFPSNLLSSLPVSKRSMKMTLILCLTYRLY